MDQVRLQLQLFQQLDQPAQPSAASKATGVPGTSAPRTGISVAGSWPGCGCAAGTGGVHDGDLRALAIDVHPDIAPHQASFPELVEPEAKAVGLTRGPGPDPHSVRWIPTVRAEVRRSDEGLVNDRLWPTSIAMHMHARLARSAK
jgi:hypothetical protein